MSFRSLTVSADCATESLIWVTSGTGVIRFRLEFVELLSDMDYNYQPYHKSSKT